MKFLLVIAVVLVAFYVWRSQRKTAPTPGKDRPQQPGAALPQDMVQCPVCSVHLPRGDAHEGKRGLYCSDEHRLRVEG